MEVEVIDGKLFHGIDLKEIGREMKNEHFSRPETIKEYMKIVSDRLFMLYGEEIDTENKIYQFMKDLEDLGVVKIREE